MSEKVGSWGGVKAGMTPEQGLRAATGNGAALLGQEGSLGALRAG